MLPPHAINETLFTEAQIQARVAEMGAQITADYPNHDEPVLLVGVLKGAAVFIADLARSIDRPIEYDFVRAGVLTGPRPKAAAKFVF